MQIEKRQNGNLLEIFVKGRLESLTAPELEAEVKSVNADVTELILDLSEMEYTSSAGLRILLFAHKMMKGRNGIMKLRGVQDNVKKILDLTAFTPILNFI